jgi:putative transposase
MIVGGVADHVHILSVLSPTSQPAVMVKEVKRGSSLWLKTKGASLASFAWQNGYGMFSIGASHVADVRRYIETQHENRRRHAYQDELRTVLHRYDVQFDERYVWD